MYPAPSSRSAFLSAAAPLFLRRMTSAFSISPPASSRAFRHCMTEMPVLSRRPFTASIEISMSKVLKKLLVLKRLVPLGLASFFEGVRKLVEDELHGRAGCIVHDYGECCVTQVAVGTHDAYDWDACLASLLGGVCFVLGVYDNHGIGTLREVRDAAHALLKTSDLAVYEDTFKLGVGLCKFSGLTLGGEVGKAVDALLDFNEVRDGSTEPASCNVRSAYAAG